MRDLAVGDEVVMRQNYAEYDTEPGPILMVRAVSRKTITLSDGSHWSAATALRAGQCANEQCCRGVEYIERASPESKARAERWSVIRELRGVAEELSVDWDAPIEDLRAAIAALRKVDS